MIMPGPNGDVVRSTGGQVDDITVALIDAAYDKDVDVQPIMSQCLYDLGKNKPKLVLSSSHSYLKKHPKLCQTHRVIILNVIEKIVKDCIDKVDVSLSSDIINQACAELTQSKDIQPEWQAAASGVLVAIGMKYCNDVMDILMQKFQPGVLPHFFVIQTFSNLAVANVYGMVPHLTAVLGTMLPMMGMAKQDNMRWVFATAICKFCEAILDYLANIESAPDKTVTKYSFSPSVFSAYDVMFNVWLLSKETKLQLSIVEAVGYMTHLFERDKLEEQLPKLLQGYMGLYRKHSEPFFITQGLCMVLDAACEDESFILEPHLDHVFSALYNQACIQPDYKNPMSLKNHNELMRCFAVMARCYSSRILSVLLGKLESTNEKIRIGTLSIIKHLINAASTHMEDKKEVIISGLKPITLDPNNKVKRVFAQVVIAMAHHNYLDLEGGQHFVEFIVANCSLPGDDVPKKFSDPEYVSNNALKVMCEHVLTLITTTISHMDIVLWPYLLEMVVPDKYTHGMSVVCQNLTFLANKKREEQSIDYMVDFEADANIPKEANLISRLFVLAGRPTHGKNRGVNILTLMQALSPNLHQSLVTLWDTIIPKLVKFLQDQESSENQWNQKQWEDLILKMLSKTLDVVDDEDWLMNLGKVMAEDVILYVQLPEEKNFLFKCLGIVLRKSTNNHFVAANLEHIFKFTKHGSQIEREGCAVAFGFTSASHLDAVLTKLENVSKHDLGKRSSSGFLNFKKEKSPETDPEKVKATLMLCYGFVMLFAPPSLIVSRLETTILRTINPHFTTTKDTIVKQNLIRTTELIAKALHPDNLKTSYVFPHKADFLVHLQNYMRTESTLGLNNETRALALNASTELVKLDPELTDKELYDLVKVATDCLMPLPVDGMPPRKGKEENYEDVLEIEILLEESFKSLHDLLTQILHKDVQPMQLYSVYQHISPWMMSVHDHERERSTHSFHVLLQYYHSNMEVGIVSKARNLSNLGVFLGRMIPRVTDPSLAVRHHAIDSIYTLLNISLKYEGLGSHKDDMVEKLLVLRGRLAKTDPTVLFSVVNDLAKIIAKKLPNDQLSDLIDLLNEALTDPQSHSSSGACVVLNCLMKLRGSLVITMVEHILSSLHNQLSLIQCPQTRAGTLRSIRTMASHHIVPVLSALLNYPLPFDEHLVGMIHVMSEDDQLVLAMLEHLLDLAQRSLPYEEKTSKDKSQVTRTATNLPIAIFSMMTEIFRVPSSQEPVIKLYHRLFAALLVRIGSMVGVQSPKNESRAKPDPSKTKDKKRDSSSKDPQSVCGLAVEAFHEFLLLTNSEGIIEDMNHESCLDRLDDEYAYANAVTVVAKAVVTHKPEYVARIVACMTSSLLSLYEKQRVVVAAFYSELLNQKCGGDSGMAELLMNSLLGRLVDNTQQVRVYCIRGMGNIASMGPSQVQRFATTVLSAMMAGMDDKEDPEDCITVEAMRGLSKVLLEIDERDIRAILINIALRIRPCFEKDKSSVRAQAIILFGNLSRFGDGPSQAPFLEQIHSNFVALLLHLNDADLEVRKACKASLRKLGPLIQSRNINDMFQKHLFEDANLFYGEFINNLSKSIIKDCADKVNFFVMGCVAFFKSDSPEMRSNAAIFVGFLLGNLPQANHGQISKEHVCSALILLLKDPAPQVRMSAAEAMSLLHNY